MRARALLVLVALGAACRTTAPPVSTRLPDPLLAPVPGAPLSKAEVRDARRAGAALDRGDFERAAGRLDRLPAAHPVSRLLHLELRYAKGEAVTAEALAYASNEKGYASAWMLAALAAERAGRLTDALGAAREARKLRPDDAAKALASGLQRSVAEHAEHDVTSMLAEGAAKDALARARATLELVPGAEPVRELAVRAALAAGDDRDAAEFVTALPDTPPSVELKGRVAEAQDQWELAMDLFRSLPENYPQRCELLEEARNRWRLSLAPPQVTQALAANPLSRKGLAAIVAWEVPDLVNHGTGFAPVFEDIVGLPESRDIVLLARAGVMPGDEIARRFHPERPITFKELSGVLARVCQAEHRPAPHWCRDAERDDCLAPPATFDGRTVASVVRRAAGESEVPCSRR
jgi:tetratricopeptide (TPR) repeat protein